MTARGSSGLARATSVTIDGLRYGIRRGGTPGAPSLLLIHGFMGSATSWEEHVPVLGVGHEIVAVDLPGHGRSAEPDDPSRASVERTAADLGALLVRLGTAPTAVVGYSLGARIALRLALDFPREVARLVLESPSAGIEEPAERASRRASDETLALGLLAAGLDAFVDRWEAQPLFASQASLPPDRRELLRRERTANRPAGLAASLRGAGQGTMEPLGPRLANLSVPTLVLAGALDPVGRRRAEAIASAVRGARLAIVPEAGHRVHLERPLVYRRLVLEFLQEAVPA